MNKFFIINQSVKFDPNSRTLIPLEKPESKVQLHTPVSECLLLLIMHNGETLSQNFLSEEVWVKKGQYVTTNSLYQCIAAIRRGLRSVDLEDCILKTIPKSGFQFYASITVLVENTPVLHTLENPETAPDITEPVFDGTKKNNLSNRYLNVAGLFICCFLMLVIFSRITAFSWGPSLLSTYTHIGVVDKCELYSSYTGIDMSTHAFRTLIHSWGKSCSDGEKAWLTFNNNYLVSSIIICDKDIEENDVSCKSFVYSGAIHE